MDLTVTYFDKNLHYFIVELFCEQHNIELINKDLLSSCGLIISQNDIPIVCGWLYPTIGSKMCVIENVIKGTSTIDKSIVDESLKLLFVNLHMIAKDMGYKYIKNSVENKSMKNRLESYGYVAIQDNLTNYMGVL